MSTMRLSNMIAVALSLALTSAAVAETQEQLLSSIPAPAGFVLPDPTHIPIVFGKDIKWKGGGGEHTALLFGDPAKPGIYEELVRWDPGTINKPHTHSTVRYIYVVSGTWWVSSSTHYDESKMYPVPAGSFVTDVKDAVHWDGAKSETGTCILLLVGEGPMHNTRYVPADPSKDIIGQDFVPPLAK